MTKHFLIIALVILCGCKSSQHDSIKLRLIDSEVDFIAFYSLVSGPQFFFESVDDFHHAGYGHRVFKSFYEIFSVVFIDRISIDIEGGASEMLWFRELDLEPLYEKYSFYEESDHFVLLEWIDSDSFTFEISDKKFQGVIMEDGKWVEVTLL